MAERIRVLLVDDHAMFREGVRSLLEGEPDLEVVGEVEDGRAGGADGAEPRPRRGPDGHHHAPPRRHRGDPADPHRQRAIKVLILAMHDNEDVFFRSISAGASGYVLKRSGGLELISAIRSTHEGNSYLSPLLAKALMSDYLQRGERSRTAPPRAAASPPASRRSSSSSPRATPAARSPRCSTSR